LAYLLITVCAFSQHLYIRYDEDCMDKYEYRFIEKSNTIAYNAYRTHNRAGDQIFFETGIESPTIRSKVTDKMIDCQALDFDQSTVADINTGKRKAYLCKKLDSGWAILPVGSVDFMAYHDNVMTYVSANYELQAQLGTYSGDNNVAMRYRDKEANASMFYLGEIPACQSRAFMFRVSPNYASRIEGDVTLMPEIGLIREKEINGETFELVSINDMPVCNFINPNPRAIANSEPQPETVTMETTATQGTSSYQSGAIYENASTTSYSMGANTAYQSTGTVYNTQPSTTYQTGNTVYNTTTYVPTGSPLNPNIPVTTFESDIPSTYINTGTINYGTYTTTETVRNESSRNYEAPTYAEPSDVAITETSSETPVSSKSVDENAKSVCGIFPMEGEHLVEAGESLYGVARRYGITVNNLRSWNDMTTDVIQPCTLIKIVEPAKADQPSMELARSNDVPASYDKKVVKPTVVMEETPVVKKAINCKTVANEGEHVVQQGESLFAIARQYNVKVEQLHAWNDMASDIIHPCDKLTVVEPAVVAPKKVVKRAEPLPKTYAVIIKPKSVKVNSKPKAVVKATPKKVVEKPKMAVVAKPKQTVVTSKSVSTTETALTVKKGAGLYVVKTGENVAILADRFELSETEFRKVNNLGKTEKIFAGQVIKTENCACNIEEELPKTYNTVVVKPKGVPRSYNEVSMPKPIKIKDQVVTPKGVGDDGEDLRRKYHVVQGNETLFGIARMYGTSVEKLRKTNDLGENEALRTEQLLILDK
jgi:LysM repeat protein